MKKHDNTVFFIAVVLLVIGLITVLLFAFHHTSAYDVSDIINDMANIQLNVDEHAKQNALDAFYEVKYDSSP